MKYLLAILIFTNLVVYLREPSIVVQQRPVGDGDYSDVKSFINHDENTCRVAGDHFDFTVTVYYAPSEEWSGLWSGDTMEMYLNPKNGMDIDTIAHEAWHAVDDMLVRFDVEDGHYGAYMQGRLTYCVWLLVEEDQKL